MDLDFEQRSASGCELVTEVASCFGEVRLGVTGVSMLPTIWPGDILNVRSCGIAELQVGLIVLYRRQGKLVAHRITCIQDNVLTTRGDSVPHDDEPTCEDNIVGQVVSVLRKGRSVPFELSFWNRAGSHVLRRSEFCVRATMLLVRYLQRPDPVKEETSWV